MFITHAACHGENAYIVVIHSKLVTYMYRVRTIIIPDIAILITKLYKDCTKQLMWLSIQNAACLPVDTCTHYCRESVIHNKTQKQLTWLSVQNTVCLHVHTCTHYHRESVIHNKGQQADSRV